MKRATRRSGFTLIELVVAIAIFSVMAVFAYQGLRNFIAMRAKIEAHEGTFIELVTAFNLLEQDFASALPRPVRDELGAAVAAVNGSGGPTPTFALTCQSAWAPLKEAGSDLRRVEYRLDHDTLIRRTWAVLDRLPDSKYTERALLRGLARIELQYFDTIQWVDAWPRTRGAPGLAQLPRAVSVVVNFTDGRRIERVFMLSGAG